MRIFFVGGSSWIDSGSLRVSGCGSAGLDCSDGEIVSHSFC